MESISLASDHFLWFLFIHRFCWFWFFFFRYSFLRSLFFWRLWKSKTIFLVCLLPIEVFLIPLWRLYRMILKEILDDFMVWHDINHTFTTTLFWDSTISTTTKKQMRKSHEWAHFIFYLNNIISIINNSPFLNPCKR